MNEVREDAWYAIGGSALLGPGDVQPVHLGGVERVAWRGADGESHVWHNRCIHRGMRLQYGFVEGDRLACRYHGWRFGGDGKCTYIPAHPDMTPPEDFCVPAAPSVESDGLIWTSIGTPDGPPPDLSEFGTLTYCRSVAVNCAAATIEAAAAKTSFTPFSAAPPSGGFLSRHPMPGIIVIETAPDIGESLVLALQPAGGTKTHLHVLSTAAVTDNDIPALRRHFSAWARRFRGQAEAAAA